MQGHNHYEHSDLVALERVLVCLIEKGRSGCKENDRSIAEIYIEEQSKTNLNGVSQYVSIRAEKENAPLLLYLHGGPGDAALPLVMKHNKMLEQKFTVVIWEQRGAGKSYYKFDGPVTIAVFVNDLHTLVEQLLARFHQSSLYLLGHSWGSILGLLFVQAYPELVRTYIGCGQVVNMRKTSKMAYDYALEHADKRSRKKLLGIDWSYQGEGWLKDLLFVTKQVVKHKGSLYGKKNYNDLALPFLFSKTYTIPDLIGGKRAVCKLYNLCGRKSCKQTLKPKRNMALQSYLSKVDMTFMCPLRWRRNTLTELKRKSSFIGLRNPVTFPNGAKAKGLMSLCVIYLYSYALSA